MAIKSLIVVLCTFAIANQVNTYALPAPCSTFGTAPCQSCGPAAGSSYGPALPADLAALLGLASACGGTASVAPCSTLTAPPAPVSPCCGLATPPALPGLHPCPPAHNKLVSRPSFSFSAEHPLSRFGSCRRFGHKSAALQPCASCLPAPSCSGPSCSGLGCSGSGCSVPACVGPNCVGPSCAGSACSGPTCLGPACACSGCCA